VDTSAPPFDLNLTLYRQQLNKDLAINIYSDGKWGAYRYLPLDSCATVAVPHAYVSIMTPGDLSSFRWLEGNLNPGRCGSTLLYNTVVTFKHCYALIYGETSILCFGREMINDEIGKTTVAGKHLVCRKHEKTKMKMKIIRFLLRPVNITNK
jgi:hypothetical protein